MAKLSPLRYLKKNALFCNKADGGDDDDDDDDYDGDYGDYDDDEVLGLRFLCLLRRQRHR